jgi:hypothetical protein
MPPHAKVDAGSRNELFLASFEKIVVWPLLVDFGYFSKYIWLPAAQEPTNPAYINKDGIMAAILTKNSAIIRSNIVSFCGNSASFKLKTNRHQLT